MSIHPSLRGVDNLVGERSVFTRLERIQILMKAGKFDPESGKVHGLPKVRTRFKAVGAKKKGPAAEAGAEAKPAEAES
jgi:small basic protein (TIGR04137 family)